MLSSDNIVTHEVRMSAKSTPADFWSRVTIHGPDDCWEWQGSTNSSGYGTLSWHGTATVAHRLAYYLEHGGIELRTGKRESRPQNKNAFILHSCDNRKCCNPAHLSLGSYSENQRQAYARNRRHQPQSGHANAKLTKNQVQEIRRNYKTKNYTHVSYAKKFNVSPRVIASVAKRESYRDVF